MFRNYLTVALRNIIRHKLYSFINIAGLAVGLTCLILIILFVRDELSYDKWIPGGDARPGPRGARRNPAGLGIYVHNGGWARLLRTCHRGRSEFPAGDPVAA